MKRLSIIRHGKSSWEHEVPDHKRPLKNRAYRDGELVSGSFKAFATKEPMLWTSHAVRALETAKIFRKALEVRDENFEIREELYTFDEEELLRVIQSCDDSVEHLMVFGHNPGMTALVNSLGNKPLDNLPTTGLCVMDFDVDSWKEIRKGKTILTLLPRELH